MAKNALNLFDCFKDGHISSFQCLIDLLNTNQRYIQGGSFSEICKISNAQQM